MASSSRVIADAGACIGYGNCAAVAPDVFDLDEEGTVAVRQSEVTGEQAALAEEAADNCPAFAITLKRISCGSAD
jgi:ferredoxin